MDVPKTITSLKGLITNDFEEKLLDASFKNLEDKNNILRFNNFAYSIRELSRHILCSLAPDSEVLSCTWYKNQIPEKENGITRGQRIKYAIQGGLNDQILSNQVIDIEFIEDSQKSLKESINMLSKFTHVNENTFEISQTEIDKLVSQVIVSFKLFLATIEDSRRYIINEIEEKLTNELIEKTLWEVSDDLDILASHHNIEDIHIETYHITKIKATELEIIADGNLSVRLQYGSNGDLKRGDGVEMEMKFPFSSRMSAFFKKKIQYADIEVEKFDVDTDRYYE